MAECTHDCSTCGESCGERTEPQSFLKEHNPAARVGKVYGIVSRSEERRVGKECRL